MGETNDRSVTSPVIDELQERLAGGQSDAVDQLWQRVHAGGGTPWVEQDPADPGRVLVTFLWRGSHPFGPLADGVGDPDRVQSVTVTAPALIPSGGTGPAPLRRLPGSDLWWHSAALPADGYGGYWLTVTGRGLPRPVHAPDPANPRTVPTLPLVYGSRGSMFRLPEARELAWSQPGDIAPPPVRLRQHTLHSTVLGQDRELFVYPPAQIPDQGCRLLVLFDGVGYIQLVPGPAVLDALHARQAIPPTILVAVQPVSLHARNFELWCNPQVTRFVATELVPWLREQYPVVDGPEAVTVGGFSLGGLAAGYAALEYPQVFGNVLAQSGAFWRPANPGTWGRDARRALAALGLFDGAVDDPYDTRLEQVLKDFQVANGLPPTGMLSQPTGRALAAQSGLRFDEPDAGAQEWEWLAREVAQRPRLPLRWHLGPGRLEDGPGEHPSILAANRHLRDVLVAKGYPVSYAEHPGGHDPVCWAETLADGLIALAGAAETVGSPR